ncbi:MAG: DeoR/GlpR transcriptional regulator [Spirochaetaceae bacterium]|nr:MAG: DeoR/GlpR transcriptional regulator [Spirochaetaceae bacterium]
MGSELVDRSGGAYYHCAVRTKPPERKDRILELLRALQKELSVEHLASEFSVSPLTIRRDLEALARDNLIIRTHGGCMALGRTALETEYNRKVARNFDLKKEIARRTIEDISDGETILLNDGSTTFHVAMQLHRLRSATVYTNSLAIVSEFTRHRHIKLFILGGEYSEELYSMHGSLTEFLLEKLHFDRVILGADAVNEEGTCIVPTPEEARLTRIMMQNARHRILVADHTKIRARSHVACAHLSEFECWITSAGIAEEDLRNYAVMTRMIVADSRADTRIE